MSFSLTFLASADTPHLTPAHLALVMGELDRMGIRFDLAPQAILPHRAARLTLEDTLDLSQIQCLQGVLEPHAVDVFISSANRPSPSRLLIADMDSTILQGETLDDIAAHIGVGPQVTAMTARAMRGELDFRAALAARLDLIAGTPIGVLGQVWKNQRVSPGAATLLTTLNALGTHCILISGGFTFFTERVAGLLGFHAHHGNILTFEGGRIAATLTEPFINKNAKLELLESYAKDLRINLEDTIAIGDGANDLSMLTRAGLGLAYRPKQILREHISNQILYGDLTAALYAAGIDPALFHLVPDPVPS